MWESRGPQSHRFSKMFHLLPKELLHFWLTSGQTHIYPQWMVFLMVTPMTVVKQPEPTVVNAIISAVFKYLCFPSTPVSPSKPSCCVSEAFWITKSLLCMTGKWSVLYTCSCDIKRSTGAIGLIVSFIWNILNPFHNVQWSSLQYVVQLYIFRCLYIV